MHPPREADRQKIRRKLRRMRECANARGNEEREGTESARERRARGNGEREGKKNVNLHSHLHRRLATLIERRRLVQHPANQKNHADNDQPDNQPGHG